MATPTHASIKFFLLPEDHVVVVMLPDEQNKTVIVHESS